MNESYPQRPPYFSMKFTRLLVKACVANEHGPQVFTLLATVAATEDSAKYQRAVTFYDSQLMPLIGANSQDTLARVRSRAVAAGWLAYKPGRKGVPGSYWVTIPATAEAFTDAPVDEHPEEDRAVSTAPVRSKAGRIRGRKPGESAVESREKAGRMCGPSLPVPIPSPKECANRGGSPSPARTASPKKTAPAKPASGPHAEAVAAFCDLWRGKYGAKYAFAGGKDGDAVRWVLEQLDGDTGRFRAVATRFLADDDPFYRDGRHTLGMLRAQLNRWIVEPPATVAGSPPANPALERARRADVAPPMSLNGKAVPHG